MSNSNSSSNAYALSLLAPSQYIAGVPDADQREGFLKRLDGTANLTGLTSFVLVHQPGLNDGRVNIYVQTLFSGRPALGYVGTVALDEDLSANYSQIRLVSAGMEVWSDTIPSGSFSIQGRITASTIHSQIDYSNFDVNTLTSFSASGVVNQSLQTGIVSLYLPASAQTYRPTSIYPLPGPLASTNTMVTQASQDEQTLCLRYNNFSGPALFVNPSAVSTANVFTLDSFTVPSYLPLIGRFTFDLTISGTNTVANSGQFIVTFRYLDSTGALVTYAQSWMTSSSLVIGQQMHRVRLALQSPVPITQIAVGSNTTGLNVFAVTDIQLVITASDTQNSNSLPMNVTSVTGLSASQSTAVNLVANYECIPNLVLQRQLQLDNPLPSPATDYMTAHTALRAMRVKPVMTRREYAMFMDSAPQLLTRKALKDAHMWGWDDMRASYDTYIRPTLARIVDNRDKIADVVNSFNPYAASAIRSDAVTNAIKFGQSMGVMADRVAYMQSFEPHEADSEEATTSTAYMSGSQDSTRKPIDMSQFPVIDWSKVEGADPIVARYVDYYTRLKSLVSHSQQVLQYQKRATKKLRPAHPAMLIAKKHTVNEMYRLSRMLTRLGDSLPLGVKLSSSEYLAIQALDNMQIIACMSGSDDKQITTASKLVKRWSAGKYAITDFKDLEIALQTCEDTDEAPIDVASLVDLFIKGFIELQDTAPKSCTHTSAWFSTTFAMAVSEVPHIGSSGYLRKCDPRLPLQFRHYHMSALYFTTAFALFQKYNQDMLAPPINWCPVLADTDQGESKGYMADSDEEPELDDMGFGEVELDEDNYAVPAQEEVFDEKDANEIIQRAARKRYEPPKIPSSKADPQLHIASTIAIVAYMKKMSMEGRIPPLDPVLFNSVSEAWSASSFAGGMSAWKSGKMTNVSSIPCVAVDAPNNVVGKVYVVRSKRPLLGDILVKDRLRSYVHFPFEFGDLWVDSVMFTILKDDAPMYKSMFAFCARMSTLCLDGPIFMSLLKDDVMKSTAIRGTSFAFAFELLMHNITGPFLATGGLSAKAPGTLTRAAKVEDKIRIGTSKHPLLIYGKDTTARVVTFKPPAPSISFHVAVDQDISSMYLANLQTVQASEEVEDYGPITKFINDIMRSSDFNKDERPSMVKALNGIKMLTSGGSVDQKTQNVIDGLFSRFNKKSKKKEVVFDSTMYTVPLSTILHVKAVVKSKDGVVGPSVYGVMKMTIDEFLDTVNNIPYDARSSNYDSAPGKAFREAMEQYGYAFRNKTDENGEEPPRFKMDEERDTISQKHYRAINAAYSYLIKTQKTKPKKAAQSKLSQVLNAKPGAEFNLDDFE